MSKQPRMTDKQFQEWFRGLLEGMLEGKSPKESLEFLAGFFGRTPDEMAAVIERHKANRSAAIEELRTWPKRAQPPGETVTHTNPKRNNRARQRKGPTGMDDPA